MTPNPNDNLPPGVTDEDIDEHAPDELEDDMFDDDPYHADNDPKWGTR